jgi:hypothetical protein
MAGAGASGGHEPTAFLTLLAGAPWMAGSSPAMTNGGMVWPLSARLALPGDLGTTCGKKETCVHYLQRGYLK